jgi:eukaryotic-like serine/threonine-protein kinase
MQAAHVENPAVASASPLRDDSAPTLVTDPPEQEREPASRSLATQAAHIHLQLEDKLRSGNLAVLLSALAAMGVCNESLVVRSGSPILHRLAIGLLASVAVGGIVIRALRGARDGVRVTATLFFGAALVLAYFVESLHVGVFSDFQSIAVLVLCVYGLEGRRHLVLPFVVATCLLYAVPTMLIAWGVVRDPGIIVATGASRGENVLSVVTQLAICLGAFLLARRTRRSMQATVEKSNQAMLEARLGRALLAEANQNLEMVLRAGAARGGRYTGCEVGGFELGSVVGRGAIGEVYAAERRSDRRRAAVKLLGEHSAGDEALVKRLLREAEIVGRLRAPNVVELLDAGVAPDGMPYLAMELLVGHDLSWHLRQRTRMHLDEVVSMVEEVALGLQAAHDLGIVHRDLKPSNLWLHERAAPLPPVWKILDFGIGKLHGSRGTLTDDALLGTPGFMAPEQIESRAVDARADVFALGVVAIAR